MIYDGITRDSLFLLADNRFRDSKAYYEEHKEEMDKELENVIKESEVK